MILARTLSMSLEESDCETPHLVTYEIKTDKHLKKLNGKWYKLNKDDRDLQNQNIPSILLTFKVFHLEISGNDCNLLQFKNI